MSVMNVIINHSATNCDIYDYKATRLDHLKTHKQVVQEVLIHNCDLCNNKVTRLDALNRHKQAVHEGIIFL